MNKISDTYINTKLADTYNYYITEFSENQILGVFVEGLANYGFAEIEDEVKVVAIYLPKFDELCCEYPSVIETDYGKMYDLRLMYDATNDEKNTALEYLYGYRYINPQYEEIFNKYLIDKREIIGHYSYGMRILKARSRALAAVHKGDYFEAYRLYISAQNYIANCFLDECFRPTNPDTIEYLWKLKHGKETLSYFLVEEMFHNLWCLCEGVSANKEADECLKEGIIALMAAALQKNIKADSNETIVKNKLTKNEQKAYELICSKLVNNEGMVVISQLLNESTISRPVFKNTLNKMEKNKMAIIENRGVKGTYIKLLL